jgi:hypothetical protein
MSTAKASKAEPSAKMPNDTVRAIVSLWLLFHLLALALTFATDGPGGPGRSELLERAKRAPILSQYLYALWLDVTYAYPLTLGDLDGDYSIDVEPVYADGHHGDRMPLAPADAHGERRERYQMLARRAAPPADSEDRDPTFPSYVGGAVLKQMQDDGVKELLFHVRRHGALNRSDAASSDPSQRDASASRTYFDLLTASVTLDSLGVPQVSFPQAARDVAPPTNPGTSPGRRPISPGNRSPASPPSAAASTSADKMPELPKVLRSPLWSGEGEQSK